MNPQYPQPSAPPSHVHSAANLASELAQHNAETPARREMNAQGVFGDKGPMKFFLKNGEQADIIILDASFSAGTIIHEHRLRGQDGKYNITERCIAATHNCPICAQGNKVSKLLTLTILDLRGYTRKEPPYEQIPYSRKVLPINFANLQKWQQMVETPALQVGGTLRGTYLRLMRGSEQTSAAIGDPIPVEGGRLFLSYDEASLNHYWASPARTDQQGKVLAPAGQSIQVFDYAKAFPAPDIQGILARYGSVGVGNHAAAVREFTQPPPQARGTRTAGPPLMTPPAYGNPPVQPQTQYSPPPVSPAPQSPPPVQAVPQPRQYIPQTAAQFADSTPPPQAALINRNPTPPQLPQAQPETEEQTDDEPNFPESADDGMPFGNG